MKKAVHRSDLDGKDEFQKLAEGEFYFTQGDNRIVCFVPSVGIADLPLNVPNGWEWDGNRELPTLEPSIHSSKGKRGYWHGYLTNGVWRQI